MQLGYPGAAISSFLWLQAEPNNRTLACHLLEQLRGLTILSPIGTDVSYCVTKEADGLDEVARHADLTKRTIDIVNQHYRDLILDASPTLQAEIEEYATDDGWPGYEALVKRLRD